MPRSIASTESAPRRFRIHGWPALLVVAVACGGAVSGAMSGAPEPVAAADTSTAGDSAGGAGARGASRGDSSAADSAGAASSAPAKQSSGARDSSAARAAPAGDPALGKKVFVAKQCATCHKADGSGGIKLSGNPTPNWRDSKRMSDPAHGDAYLRECITNGRPKSGMPAWAKTGVVKASDIPHLIAYIRTFSAPKTK